MSGKGLMYLTCQDLGIIEMQIKLLYFSPIRFKKKFFLSAGKHAVTLFLYTADGRVIWYDLPGKHLAMYIKVK